MEMKVFAQSQGNFSGQGILSIDRLDEGSFGPVKGW